MPTPAKKTNKSITFTPEAADQTLLAAIEAALTEEEYNSFSDLCKQALQQVLLNTQSAPVHDKVDWATVLAPLQQQIAHLEAKVIASQSQCLDELNQQLTQTTQQLEALHTRSDWKQPANNQTTEYLNQLTSQLVHLTTQVEAIETNIAQQFAELQSQFSQHQTVSPVLSPNVATTPSEPVSTQVGITAASVTPEPVLIFKEPPPKATVAAASHESDPILSRLSSLLEDF